MSIKTITICTTLFILTSTQGIIPNFWDYNNTENSVLAKLTAYIENTPEGIRHPDVLQDRDLYILNVKKRMARLLTQTSLCQNSSKTSLKGYLEQEISLILALIAFVYKEKIMSINKFSKFAFLSLLVADLALFLDGNRNVRNSRYDLKNIYDQWMETQSLLLQLERL